MDHCFYRNLFDTVCRVKYHPVFRVNDLGYEKRYIDVADFEEDEEMKAEIHNAWRQGLREVKLPYSEKRDAHLRRILKHDPEIGEKAKDQEGVISYNVLLWPTLEFTVKLELPKEASET